MRFYISGPISCTNDVAERFGKTEERLERLGIEVVNPSQLERTMPNATHSEYMSICMKLLGKCDAVILLPGWSDSQGAQMEYQKAKELGLPIFLDLLGEPPEWEGATKLGARIRARNVNARVVQLFAIPRETI